LRMGIGENHPLRVDAMNLHSTYLKLSKNNNKSNLLEQKKRIAPDRGQERR
jgi:hypothetical protein